MAARASSRTGVTPRSTMATCPQLVPATPWVAVQRPPMPTASTSAAFHTHGDQRWEIASAVLIRTPGGCTISRPSATATTAISTPAMSSTTKCQPR